MKVPHISQWYAVEASPLGGLAILQVEEILWRNTKAFEAGKLPSGWEILGMWPSLQLAEEMRRQFKARRRERRNDGAQGACGEGGPRPGADEAAAQGGAAGGCDGEGRGSSAA